MAVRTPQARQALPGHQRPTSSPDARPRLDLGLAALLQDITARLPRLTHVDPRRLLVVAGQARGAARASIRSLAFGPDTVRVTLGRQRKLYEITLRPLWFRQSTVERRLEALLHELWHIDAEAVGRLDAEHQHRPSHRRAQRAEIRGLLEQALTTVDPLRLAPLGHHGEVLMPAWLQRPVLTGEPQRRRRYDAEDVYLQVCEMLTARAHRTVWW